MKINFLCMVLWVCAAPSVLAQNTMKKHQISIDKLEINEYNNSILIHISSTPQLIRTVLDNQAPRLEIDMIKRDALYTNMVIKDKKKIDKKALVLSIQSPIKDAIYEAEELEFVLHWDHQKISKKAILGSVLYPYDLRPYTYFDTLKSLTLACGITSVLTIILMSITPLFQKYRFKKNHIKKYVANQENIDLDPFTFIIIQDRDDVVDVDGKLMLLSSWKRLNALPESKPAQEYNEFFKERLEGTFFNPKTANFRRINKAWYGLIGMFTGWFCYISFKEEMRVLYTNLLSPIFDNDELLASFGMTTDLLLGSVIGVTYGLMVTLADYIHKSNNSSFFKSLTKMGWRTLLILFSFLIQGLLTIYCIDNENLSAFIAWMCIAFFFTIVPDLNFKISRQLLIGIPVGAIAFGIMRLLHVEYLINIFGMDIATFVVLTIIGTLPILCQKDNLLKSLHLDRWYRSIQLGNLLNKNKTKIQKEIISGKTQSIIIDNAQRATEEAFEEVIHENSK